MNVLIIIGSCVAGLLLFLNLIFWIKSRNRKKMISDWKVGDVVIFTSKFWVKNNETINSAVLTGWNLDNFFIAYDGYTYVVDYDKLEINKSAVWRKHYSSCEQVMGAKPSFNPKVELNKVSVSSNTFNGKSIDMLNETECEIFLKECISREDFETATLIRKRMEKFR